jgi:hypothetical protein
MTLHLKEAGLKLQVEQYLQFKQNQGALFYLRLNAGQTIITNDEGIRRRINGCPPGTADFLVLIGVPQNWITIQSKLGAFSWIIFLELKSEKGKQTDEQKEFEERVKKFGAEYRVIRSIEELEVLV